MNIPGEGNRVAMFELPAPLSCSMNPLALIDAAFLLGGQVLKMSGFGWLLVANCGSVKTNFTHSKHATMLSRMSVCWEKKENNFHIHSTIDNLLMLLIISVQLSGYQDA